MNLDISRPVHPGDKNLFQLALVAVCVFLTMLEGFDLLATTFIAPYLSAEWRLSGAQLGVLFSSGLLGMGIGNFFVVPAADRIGRRPAILLALCATVAGMFLSSMAQSIFQLTATRLITGVGIGTLMPCTTVIVAEFTTEKWRSAAISIQGTAFAVGAMVGGGFAAHLLSHYSWRSVFVFGALATAAMIPFVLGWLPESLQYLVGKQTPDAMQRINRILKRIRYQPLERMPAVRSLGANLSLLARFRLILGSGYRKHTLMIWTAQVMVAVSFYIAMSWTPKFATEIGYTKQVGVFAGVLLNVGGMIGTTLLAVVSTKIRLSRLLPAYLLSGAAVVGLFGMCGHLAGAMVVFPLLTGAVLNGSLAAIYCLGPNMYPSEVRAMGIGWLQGVSRIGAVMGPLLAGVMLDVGWTVGDVFEVLALPLVVAMVAVSVIFNTMGRPAVGVGYGLPSEDVRPAELTARRE